MARAPISRPRLPDLVLAAACAGLVAIGGPSVRAGAASPQLAVVDSRGDVLSSDPLPESGRWCLHWNHSVSGIPVRDCFRADATGLWLTDTLQPDFAAGLGHIPGRGQLRQTPDGAYLIEGIDERIPGDCLRLRVGRAPVSHRIVFDDGRTRDLTARAAGAQVGIGVRPSTLQTGQPPC